LLTGVGPHAQDTAFSRVLKRDVAQIQLTRRRWANGCGARLAAFLSSLVFAFALAIGAIQDNSYELAPMDGVDYDAAPPFLGALRNEGIKDFSKHEKAFRRNPGEVVGSRSIDALSATARSALLKCRDQHPPPPKLLSSPERRASGNASTDPH